MRDLVDLRARPRPRGAAVDLEQPDRLARGRRSGAISTARSRPARARASSAGSAAGSPSTIWPMVWCDDDALGRRVVVEGEALARRHPVVLAEGLDAALVVEDDGDGDVVGVDEALDQADRAVEVAATSETRDQRARPRRRGCRARPRARGRVARRMPQRASAATSAATAVSMPRPRRAGAAERVALAVGDVEAPERAQLLDLLDALGADRGARARGEARQRLEQRDLGRVGVDAADRASGRA